MNRLSLKAKFCGLALLSLILMLLLGLFALWTFQQLLDREEARQEHMRVITQADKALLDGGLMFKQQVQSWKNMLLRASKPQEYATQKDKFMTFERQVQHALTSARDMAGLTRQQQQDFDALILAHKHLGESYRQALQRIDVNNPASALEVDSLVKGIDQPFTDALQAQIATHAHSYAVLQSQDAKATLADLAQARQQIVRLIILCIVLLFLALYFILSSVLRQIGGEPRYVEVIAKSVAEGDLTVKIPNHYSPSILSHLQTMVEQLSDHIVNVIHTSRALEKLSGQVDQAAAELARNANEQAIAVEQNSSALEQTLVTVHQNTRHSQLLSRLLDMSPEVADLIDEINYASKEQTSSLQHASHNLMRLAQVTQQNAQQSEKLSLAASSLAAQTRDLDDLIGRFKTNRHHAREKRHGH
ncbi:hypothetical protein NT239_10730 [Chitinibacter sp. SCUT-21]|uniref:hypothetical protein n=1 Tax=Chitinibacter sp. SCUT-21 TaxID=2970891 RepID=UPI0035A6B76B